MNQPPTPLLHINPRLAETLRALCADPCFKGLGNRRVIEALTALSVAYGAADPAAIAIAGPAALLVLNRESISWALANGNERLKAERARNYRHLLNLVALLTTLPLRNLLNPADPDARGFTEQVLAQRLIEDLTEEP